MNHSETEEMIIIGGELGHLTKYELLVNILGAGREAISIVAGFRTGGNSRGGSISTKIERVGKVINTHPDAYCTVPVLRGSVRHLQERYGLSRIETLKALRAVNASLTVDERFFRLLPTTQAASGEKQI